MPGTKGKKRGNVEELAPMWSKKTQSLTEERLTKKETREIAEAKKERGKRRRVHNCHSG